MQGKGSKAASEDLISSANRTVDNVLASAHEKVDQMSDKVQPVMDRMASNAHAAIDTVAGAAVTAVDELSVKGKKLTKAQTKLLKAAREYTRERPIATLGIAVAAGWILSRLVR
jgi:ElaB/YqjD/DUF883 family membrane-anchored ribosome-binding protein